MDPEQKGEKRVTSVHLGLGSNLGEREEYLRSALRDLWNGGFRTDAVSSVYETDPVGPVADQPRFLNCVARGEYDGTARELLKLIAGIEKGHGRKRIVRGGPRTLDIDILYFGDRVIEESPALVVPHPLIARREFVLVPLAQIDPNLIHPLLGMTQKELLGAAGDRSGVHRYRSELEWNIGISR